MVASAAGLAPSGNLKFSKDGKFLENKVTASIELTADKVPGMAAALLENQAFPADTIHIASLDAHVSGDLGSVKFAGDRGVVSFKGGAGVRAGFGAYTKGSALLTDLDPDNNTLNGISLPQDDIARFVALNWGYDIQAAVKGSVALGFGTSLKFGADGQNTGLFAVIRGFAKEPGSRDAIQDTIDSWMLPGQIESVADLQPGTWIIAEVDGQFAASLGVQFGYDYSWLRNVNLQGLSGDIGLRIAAAAAVTVGFDVSGKYLVVVARESLNESDRIARVRLFKMSKKGWNFALNASVGVTTSTGKFLPGELDDFIAGVFGVHGPQLVKDLQKFRAWTDPTVPLEEKFAGFISHYVTTQLKTHAGDAVAKVMEARKRIQGLLTKWDNLPHTISSLVWTEIRKGAEAAATFEDALRFFAGGTDQQIKTRVTQVLNEVDFFRTPIGKWLEGIATGNLLTVVANQAEVRKVRDAAKQVLDFLDGKVLEELAAFVNKELHIDLIRDIVDKSTLDGLDDWFRTKLSEFIGKNVDLTALKEIQKTLHFLDTKSAELYKAALAALNKTWTASVITTYSSTTTNTALIDLSFDFGENPSLGDSLISVIDGNWKSTLVGRPAGVKINQAVLTHGVKRQNHIEVTLPYFNTALDKFNNAATTMTFDAEDGGVYLLTVEDRITRRRKWQSTVSLTSKIAIHTAKSSLNVFPTPTELADASTYSYTLLMPRKNLTTTELEQQFGPIIQEYFRQAFDQPGKASFAEWIADLDKFADQVENNGTFNLGNTTLKLDLAVPGKCVAAWFNAPSRKATRVPYQVMSRNIQRALRKFIPLCYFDVHHKYIEQPIAAQILVYASLPVSTGIKLKTGQVTQVTLDADVKTLFWEFDDPRDRARNERHAMIFHPLTKKALRGAMRQARMILQRSPDRDLSSFASDYADTDTRINALCEWSYRDNDPNMLMKLLRSESVTIDRAVEAGQALADFRNEAVDDPDAALESLAEFGAKVTETFNSQLSDLVGGPILRALGSAVFLEAAKAFDESVADVDPVAHLDFTVLRSTAPKSWPDDFLDGKPFDPHIIAIEQPIVNI